MTEFLLLVLLLIILSCLFLHVIYVNSMKNVKESKCKTI